MEIRGCRGIGSEDLDRPRDGSDDRSRRPDVRGSKVPGGRAQRGRAGVRRRLALASRSSSIMALLNQVKSEDIVLRDLQRDVVWSEDQIRMLLDTILRG